ncbi:RNI-like protein [Trametopsis cervina]|nr:RNI-like protein [Trametopsis cervina]
MSATRPKRQRKAIPKDPLEDDELPTAHTMANAPSSSAWSIREIPKAESHVAPLISLCIQVFATNMRKLATRPSLWESNKEILKVMPEAIIPRLRAALRNSCPTFLSHEFISTYLLRGAALELGDDMPGVGKATVLAINRLASCATLRELNLNGLQQIPDDTFASVVSHLPSLEVLKLRECTKVGARTVEAAATHCTGLESVNFSFTAVTPISLQPLLTNCSLLEVLKVAGIPGWTDATFLKLWAQWHLTGTQLPNLRTLKIRQTSITDASLSVALAVCPNIRRLDISFTGVRHAGPLTADTMEKLNLTSTKHATRDLFKVLNGMKNLKSLSIGALGRGEGTAAVVSNTNAMTLTDQDLTALTLVLQTRKSLESISIAGNTKLAAATGIALTNFITNVGRYCKILNLAGISSLRSRMLEGLLADDDEQDSPLETLILNNTNVDDAAAVYISSCKSLRILELASTKFTGDGLNTILDACPMLERLNLTSCRGINLAQRRNFFAAYEQNHQAQSNT